jgi:7-cyano-7-deazaguanine synthase
MKSVIIFSGGIDSTVILSVRLQKTKEDVIALFFDYGSKHNEQELRAATQIARLFNIQLQVVQVGFLGNLLKSDLLQKEKDVVQEGSDDERKRVFVPFRNGIMLSLAIAYADSIGYDDVYIGTHRHVDLERTYPDCTKDFIDGFNSVACLGTYNNISVRAPLADLTKPQIVTLGLGLDSPLHLTYSCYNGGEKHCGKCGTCLDRLKAFKANNKTDLVNYELSINLGPYWSKPNDVV